MISLSGKDLSLFPKCPPERLRLVSAVQFLMPSGIARGQKRNNGLCGMMVQANNKIMKEKGTILLLGRDSSL